MNVAVSRGGEKYAIPLGLENESESDDSMTSSISRPIELLLRVAFDVVGNQAACGRDGWLTLEFSPITAARSIGRILLQLALMKREDAEELISFADMLLKFIYEFPARVPSAPALVLAPAP